MPTTKKIIVTGKVQGVFYRQSAKEQAEDLEITGTVKNCKDGSVEIIATGEPAQLDQFIGWCKRGPRQASVDNMEVVEMPLQKFNSFQIVR